MNVKCGIRSRRYDSKKRGFEKIKGFKDDFMMPCPSSPPMRSHLDLGDILQRGTDSSLLLALELVVEQEESLFVSLRGTDDGEHSLSRLIVGLLGDRYPGSRESSNLGDLGTTSTDDATDHVGGDRDRLGSHVRVVGHGGFASSSVTTESGSTSTSTSTNASSRRHRATSHGGSSSRSTESGTGTRSTSHNAGNAREGTERWGSAGSSDTTGRASDGTGAKTTGENTLVTGSSGLVLDRTSHLVPVLGEASSDLEDGGVDRFDRTLDLDNSLGGLREHLLGSDHSGTGSVLDLLDLQSLSTDNGTHEVVGNEETKGGESVVGHVSGIGERGRHEQLGNLRITGSDFLQLSSNAENSVLNTRDDFADTGFNTRVVSDLGDASTTFTDDDAGLFGANQTPDGQSTSTGLTGFAVLLLVLLVGGLVNGKVVNLRGDLLRASVGSGVVGCLLGGGGG